MKQILSILIIALLFSFAEPAFAATASAAALDKAALSGSGDFFGRAVLVFSGTHVAATLIGDLTLSGTITRNGETIPFTASGTLDGSAIGDTNTLSGTAWVTFRISGMLQTGEAIDIRGGLSIDGDDISFAGGAAGEGTGPLYLEIRLAGTMIKLTGRVEAAGSGGFVAPDDPHTMEISGSGTMIFTAASPAFPGRNLLSTVDGQGSDEGRDRFDLSTWPEEAARQLLLLLEIEDGEDGAGS